MLLRPLQEALELVDGVYRDVCPRRMLSKMTTAKSPMSPKTSPIIVCGYPLGLVLLLTFLLLAATVAH
jgi:hypothetical protein